MKVKWNSKCKEHMKEDLRDGLDPMIVRAMYTADATHLKETAFGMGRREVWVCETHLQSLIKVGDAYRVVLFKKEEVEGHSTGTFVSDDPFTTIFDAREFASDQRKKISEA